MLYIPHLVNTLDFGVHTYRIERFHKKRFDKLFEDISLMYYLGFCFRFSNLCIMYRKNYLIHIWAVKLVNLSFFKLFLTPGRSLFVVWELT